jgi:hypothetical protein
VKGEGLQYNKLLGWLETAMVETPWLFFHPDGHGNNILQTHNSFTFNIILTIINEKSDIVLLVLGEIISTFITLTKQMTISNYEKTGIKKEES